MAGDRGMVESTFATNDIDQRQITLLTPFAGEDACVQCILQCPQVKKNILQRILLGEDEDILLLEKKCRIAPINLLLAKRIK